MTGAARERARPAAGFSLLEVLLVVVILGIVTALAARTFTDRERGVDAVARAIAADLHEVQTLAIQTRLPLGIRFDVAANASTLTLEDGAPIRTNVATLRAKAGLSTDDAARILVARTSGESGFAPARLVTASFGGNAWVVFGTDGAPRTAGYVDVAVGKDQLRIRVQAATGRIAVTAP